jgi:hypothetical protein
VKSQHTPTPWKARHYADIDRSVIEDADGNELADVHGDDSDPQCWPRTANAGGIVRAVNSHETLVNALKLVLLFHSGGHWTSERSQGWANGLTSILGPAESRDPKVVGAYGDGTWDGATPTNEATSRNLCNAVRAALALAESEATK